MITATLDMRQWLSKTQKMRAIFKDKPSLLRAAFVLAGFRDIQDHFKKESGPKGRWEPRKASTQESYARRNRYDARYNPSNKLLQLTGSLRQSILASSALMQTENPNSIRVFAASSYGGKHDRGGKNTPKREFMWLSKTALDSMNQMILDRLRGA